MNFEPARALELARRDLFLEVGDYAIFTFFKSSASH